MRVIGSDVKVVMMIAGQPVEFLPLRSDAGDPRRGVHATFEVQVEEKGGLDTVFDVVAHFAKRMERWHAARGWCFPQRVWRHRRNQRAEAAAARRAGSAVARSVRRNQRHRRGTS